MFARVNFGPLESRRCFALSKDTVEFVKVVEADLIRANYQKYQKLNLYAAPYLCCLRKA